MMESQRTRLLVGTGVSLATVLITYVIYRALKRHPKKTPDRAAAPATTTTAEMASESCDDLRPEDLGSNEMFRSLPTAVSSERNIFELVNASLAEPADERTAEDYDTVVVASNGTQEPTVVEMDGSPSSPGKRAVDLDETVTLNSSDMSSRDVSEVEPPSPLDAEREDEAVTEPVVEPQLVAEVCSQSAALPSSARTDLSNTLATGDPSCPPINHRAEVIEETITATTVPDEETIQPVSHHVYSSTPYPAAESADPDPSAPSAEQLASAAATEQPPNLNRESEKASRLSDSEVEVVEITPVQSAAPTFSSPPTDADQPSSSSLVAGDNTAAYDDLDSIPPPVLASSSSTQNALDDLDLTMRARDSAEADTPAGDGLVSSSATRVSEQLDEILESFTSAAGEPTASVKLVAKEAPAEPPAEPTSDSSTESEVSEDSVNTNSRCTTADSGIGLSTGTTTTLTRCVNGSGGSNGSHQSGQTAEPEVTPTEQVNGVYEHLSAEPNSKSQSPMTAASTAQNGHSERENGVNGNSASGQSQSEGSSPLASPVSTATPPQTAESLSPVSARAVVHRFLIPAKLCGLFIGKNGKNIAALKQETNTYIKIGREPVLYNYRYCTVQGAEKDVERALRLIKRQYPEVDVTRVRPGGMPDQGNVSLPVDRMQLHLPIGVAVDAVVTSVVSAGHVFVQQPTHPSFNSYQRLADCLNKCYADGSTVPSLPDSVEEGVLCVAPVNGMWHRAHIMSISADRAVTEVKLCDVGGYAQVATSALRQIRQDFLLLPFQAIECYLSNIEPLDGEQFSEEAGELLRQITFGRLIQCEVTAAADNDMPCIHITGQMGNQVVSVNKQLVDQGLVKWFEFSES